MPDREKVILGLECCDHRETHCDSELCVECPYDLYIYPVKSAGRSCKGQLMYDALALLKEQGWNVLTEDADGVIHGLPGDDGQYLMTDGKDIWIDDYVDGVTDGIILDSGRDIREITAWMHMPELPKKDRR